MLKKVWILIEKPFLIVSGFCSVISVVALLTNHNWAAMIALAALCISIAILLIAIIRVLNRFENNAGKNGVKRIATFIFYKTNNAEDIEFDSYKILQVKSVLMTSYDVKYKWSGDKEPLLTSDLQEVELQTPSNDRHDFDNLKLKLKSPALYNDPVVIHYKSKMSDPEKTSEPKVEVKVDYTIDFIKINVALGYKPDKYYASAKLEKARIVTGTFPRYEFVKNIPFNPSLKEYSCELNHPEPGYFYKLSWER